MGFDGSWCTGNSFLDEGFEETNQSKQVCARTTDGGRDRGGGTCRGVREARQAPLEGGVDTSLRGQVAREGATVGAAGG